MPGQRGTKSARQTLIVEWISQRRVATQEELAAELGRRGFHVTQATVSRDIRELGLVKLSEGEGLTRYTTREAVAGTPSARMLQLFRDCVLDLNWGENLIVVSTLAATAQGVAEAIDGLHAPEVIGTLAGERTVFVAIRRKDQVKGFVRRLRNLLGTREGPPSGPDSG